MSIRIGRLVSGAIGIAVGVGGIGCTNGNNGKPVSAVAESSPGRETKPALVFTPSPAEPAPADRSLLALTIYSSPDAAGERWDGASQVSGFGLVRDVRRVKLNAGIGRLTFDDVAAEIDPTTVSLTAPNTIAVLEQKLEGTSREIGNVLKDSLGRTVLITLKGAPAENPTELQGRLLSVDSAAGYILQTSGEGTNLIVIPTDTVASIRLASRKPDSPTRPTLDWQIKSEKSGDQDVQLTYQTDGLAWRADYAAVMSADESGVDLSALVSIQNMSGAAYPNAKIKLVAGDVHRLQAQPGNIRFMAAARATAPVESDLMDYHLYTLPIALSLPRDSMRQCELFSTKKGVPLTKAYLYDGVPENVRNFVSVEPNHDANFGVGSMSGVDIYFKFHNGAAEHLGIPLPAGRVRMYKIDPSDGSREFLGEDAIGPIAKDEDVLLRVGSAFDVVGERTQTEFKEGAKSIAESFEIKLRNHKDQPVHVIVKETLYRWSNWEITAASDKWEKKDSRTIYFPVEVPANGEKAVTYSVKYSW